MKDNVLKIADIYCQEEMNDFKMDNYFKELSKLTQKLNLKLICDIGKIESDKNYYFGVAIENQNDEIIEVYD